jgi:glycosyltransferase involved in cell wall biosynthesis
LQLKKGLESQGHVVDILCHTQDLMGYKFTRSTGILPKHKVFNVIHAKVNRFFDHHLPGLDPWIRKMEIERYSFEAAALFFGLRGQSYDVVHTQDIITSYAFSRIKMPGVAHVATIHGCLAKEFLVRSKESIQPGAQDEQAIWHHSVVTEYLGATAADITISPSQWLKDLFVQEFSVPDEKVAVAPYGIDTEQFLQAMAQPTDVARPADRMVFIHPARFDEVKGHFYLLHALARLLQDRQDWVCWLIGDGHTLEDMRQLSSNLGLDNHVVFFGRREDVPALLNQADIFVLPSMQDNQPFALIEAQVAGKPAVVSNAGGIAEMVVHHLTGLISQAGDSEQLYVHLKMMMEDEQLRMRLAGNAQLWGREYWSLPAMVARVMEFYQQALSRHPRPMRSAVRRKRRRKARPRRLMRVRRGAGARRMVRARRGASARRAVRARRSVGARRVARARRGTGVRRVIRARRGAGARRLMRARRAV